MDACKKLKKLLCILWICLMASLAVPMAVSAEEKVVTLNLALDDSWTSASVQEKQLIADFKIVMPSDGKLSFTLQTFGPGITWSLYDKDYTFRYYTKDINNGSANSPLAGTDSIYLLAGTYHFKAYGHMLPGPGIRTVRMKATFTKANTTDHYDNHDFTSAHLLKELTLTRGMTTRDSGNRLDVYKFTVATKGVYTLYVRSLGGDNAEAVIYNNDLIKINRIATSYQSDAPYPRSMKIDLTLEKGTYYVQVKDNSMEYYKKCILYEIYYSKHKTHTWGDWKVLKAPTAVSTGQQEHTCKSCKLTEKKTIAKLPATIKVSKTSVTLTKGQTTTPVTVSGLAKGDKVSSWKSANTKIVTVNSSGKMQGVGVGSTTVTITLASGKKQAISVKVVNIKTTKITNVPSSVSVKKGYSYQLRATRVPSNSTEKLTYTTSNSSIATVSSNGLIRGVKKGKAKITVKSGTKSATVTVTVK